MRKLKSAEGVVFALDAGGLLTLGLEDSDGHTAVRLLTVVDPNPFVEVWLYEEELDRALAAVELLERWRKLPRWRKVLRSKRYRNGIGVSLSDGGSVEFRVVNDGGVLVLSATDAEGRDADVLLSADEVEDVFGEMSELYEEMVVD